jgi:hypothetical protein
MRESRGLVSSLRNWKLLRCWRNRLLLWSLMIHHDNESTSLVFVHIFITNFRGQDLEALSSRDIFNPKFIHCLFICSFYVLLSSHPWFSHLHNYRIRRTPLCNMNPTPKLHALSPLANYTDRATASCWRSDCQLFRIEGATWSAWRIPTAVFWVF